MGAAKAYGTRRRYPASDVERPFVTRYLGIDLAWSAGTEKKAANESGVVALDSDGTIVDAGWTVGLLNTLDWIDEWATEETVLFVDAPLLVLNETGMRQCEKDVGKYFGKWKVAANATSMTSKFVSNDAAVPVGVLLRQTLEGRGWAYDDGLSGARLEGKRFSECYPYATLVGAPEFGYVIDADSVGSKPTYKRQPKTTKGELAALTGGAPLGEDEADQKFGLPAEYWLKARAAVCDELIRRLAAFTTCETRIDLRSHPVTAVLVDEPSPSADEPGTNQLYKHREDVLDAAICAWTAARCDQQPELGAVLGESDPIADSQGRRGTIITPFPLEPGEAGPKPATEPTGPVTWQDVVGAGAGGAESPDSAGSPA